MHVSELFRKHCEKCIKEDKGKNYNSLQKTYANTELFDLSLLNIDWNKYTGDDILNPVIEEDVIIGKGEALKDMCLPFESVFLRLPNASDDSVTALYLHEFSPTTITGCLYSLKDTEDISLTFHILLDLGEIYMNFKPIRQYAEFQAKMAEGSFSQEECMTTLMSWSCSFLYRNIHLVIDSLNNLPKQTVVADKVTKAEYYRRKGLPTIKVYKPIYYVMDKKEGENKNSRSYKLIKPLGKLEYTYSFKVRGHWRRIDPKSYGKNRNNEYVVKGYTFVKDYIKGEGELVKRVRVLK